LSDTEKLLMPSPQTARQDHEFVFALVRELTTAYQALQSCEADHLRRYNLTPTQADIIHSLGENRAMSCRELAESAAVSRGSLTGILERLERRGLIRRTPSRTDRRVMLVRLTDAGADVLAQIEPDRITQLARRFDRLDAGKQTKLVDGLRELRQALR
jgi:MarR family 2-MHQ and catechol resistance regulon transcriptional repressor